VGKGAREPTAWRMRVAGYWEASLEVSKQSRARASR
jgi:hypothetical protein